MGFFDMFKRKNKFDKISKSEVVDSIIELEKKQDELSQQVEDNNKEVKELVKKGKAEKDTNMRSFYAKKIENLQRSNQMAGKRLQFLATNMSAMYQLKDAMDDKEFLQSNTNMSLNEMLKNPGELVKFLNSVNNMKMTSESGLESSLEAFEVASSAYVENEAVYGTSDAQADILAMFDEESIGDDIEAFGEKYENGNKTMMQEQSQQE